MASFQTPDAFPGFAPSDTYEMVHSLLSTRRRAVLAGQPKGLPPLLSNVRCGHAVAGDKPCMRRMCLIESQRGKGRPGAYYVASSCGEHSSGDRHNTIVPKYLERHVLATLGTVFTPAAVEAVVDSYRFEPNRLSALVMSAQRTFAHTRELLASAEDAELEARSGRDSDKARRMALKQETLATDILVQRTKVEQLERQARDFGRAAPADFAKIRALATNLSALFDRLPVAPEFGASLVSKMLSAVICRRIGPGLVEVTLEFPGNQKLRSILITAARQASSAEASFTAERQKGGATCEQIANELRDAVGHEARRRPWTPANVRVMMYAIDLGQMILPSADPTGLESSESVAAETGISSAKILRAALRGQLGEARFIEGILYVDPFSPLLHQTHVEFARRCVAMRAGWDLCETRTFQEIALEFRYGCVTRGALLYNAELTCGVRYDASGRAFVLRSAAGYLAQSMRLRTRREEPAIAVP